MARALADGKVDLDRAETLAKSALDQIAAAAKNVTLRSDERTANLASMASALDALGWVYLQKGDRKHGRRYLEAAYQLDPSPNAAEHLAQLRLKEEDLDGALEAYLCAKGNPYRVEPVRREVEERVTKKYGKQQIDSLVKRAMRTCSVWHAFAVPKSKPLTYPAGAHLKSPAWVRVAALVKEDGTVEDHELLFGDEPLRDAALADMRQLHFPQATWPGGALKRVRTVSFVYGPDRKVYAYWTFGRPTKAIKEPEPELAEGHGS